MDFFLWRYDRYCTDMAIRVETIKKKASKGQSGIRISASSHLVVIDA